LQSTSPLLALVFFSISLALRHVGDALYFSFMDGWSILPWTAALVAILGGRPLLRWAWPSIVFLVFLIPLPFSIENEFSGPLQRTATTLSTAVLQFLGQPAFAEGNVILIGSERLGIAEACSGLKMFVGTLVLTYAYVVIIRRPWWEKLLVVLAAVPVAIISNVARIVATGFLYQWTTNAQIRTAVHDAAGIAMFLFAAVLFWLLLAYLRLLVREEEIMDMTTVVKQCRV
jgi:exosortase